MSWHRANNFCQQTPRAHLVETLSSIEFESLQATLVFLEAYTGRKQWWTAATDEGREGAWYWVPSLSSVGDFVWRSGEPEVNMEHNCMALYPGAAYLGIPHLCLWEEAHPVCQLKH